ncbi:hypothetical protein JTE90_024647 [Oedothorax gibbosus]|uniref:Uncharacterized protein n=1 Tax=Oedothorax gibbosus TaxID=931172 RepID=A0AAV6U3I1_9ARAC|nr:hypothetical protein JTE90_024647 [Oedothorax gibbosus]
MKISLFIAFLLVLLAVVFADSTQKNAEVDDSTSTSNRFQIDSRFQTDVEPRPESETEVNSKNFPPIWNPHWNFPTSSESPSTSVVPPFPPIPMKCHWPYFYC